MNKKDAQSLLTLLIIIYAVLLVYIAITGG